MNKKFDVSISYDLFQNSIAHLHNKRKKKRKKNGELFIKPEVHDLTVFCGVFLAFQPQ